MTALLIFYVILKSSLSSPFKSKYSIVGDIRWSKYCGLSEKNYNDISRRIDKYLFTVSNQSLYYAVEKVLTVGKSIMHERNLTLKVSCNNSLTLKMMNRKW